MKKAFYEISEEKRNRIIELCFEEFSKHSYQGVSLNNILKRSNVSKGGMFKYIENKEDLYFYLVEVAAENLINTQMRYCDYNGPCYVKRVFSIIRGGQTFYKDFNYQYQFLIRTSFELEYLVQLKNIRNKALVEQRVWLMKDITWELYTEPKEKVINYISMLVKGINIELLSYDMTKQSDAFITNVNHCEKLALKGVI